VPCTALSCLILSCHLSLTMHFLPCHHLFIPLSPLPSLPSPLVPSYPVPFPQFSHPSPLPSEAIDNSRYRSVSFTATESTTIHGFAGTFESILYDDISFSTVPHTFSEGKYNAYVFYLRSYCLFGRFSDCLFGGVV
jgi:PRMT5 oligomerisation domain